MFAFQVYVCSKFSIKWWDWHWILWQAHSAATDTVCGLMLFVQLSSHTDLQTHSQIYTYKILLISLFLYKYLHKFTELKLQHSENWRRIEMTVKRICCETLYGTCCMWHATGLMLAWKRKQIPNTMRNGNEGWNKHTDTHSTSQIRTNIQTLFK